MAAVKYRGMKVKEVMVGKSSYDYYELTFTVGTRLKKNAKDLIDTVPDLLNPLLPDEVEDGTEQTKLTDEKARKRK